MKFNLKHAIGLLAALLVLAFFSVALIAHPAHTVSVVAWLFGSLAAVAGTVTVTYEKPVVGTTPPTAPQVNSPAISQVTATVNMADTDTTATLTHNFGNPSYGTSDTAQGYPIPLSYYSSAGTGPVVVAWAVNSTTAVLSKSSAAGSGGTLQVVLMRPSTNSR